MTTPDLTLRQKILLAAVSLGADAFPVEDLVVKSWQLYPESFGLRGYPQHPDAMRVLPKLAGADGLCGRGWIERTDPQTCRLTRKGRVAAARLAPAPRVASGGATAPAPEGPSAERPKRQPPPRPRLAEGLTEADRACVRRFAAAGALRKFLRGSPLTFADARAFWGAPTGRVSLTLLAEAGAVLERVVTALGAEGVDDQTLPPLSTCFGLLNLHRLMLGRFARELAALRAQEVPRG